MGRVKQNLRTAEREPDVLKVEIYVNTQLIGVATAIRRKGSTDPKSVNTYELFDGSMIRHRYGDGAAKLAAKMMNHLHKTRKI